MTTEEKAKAYDEALERAKYLHDNHLYGEPQNWWTCEQIFPELKESEDERIRKEILDCFVSMKKQGCFPSRHKERYESWIAWLEKQGEHANFRNKILIGDEVTRNQDGLLVNLSRLNRMAEKRGEKQGKKKPADKVKPTFKVGDWVVNTITNEVEQVIEITDHEYVCSGHLIISFDNQHLLNKWTIEDAKDGDVLAEETCTFIIKKLNPNLSAKIYCCLFNDGDFELSTILEFDDTSTYPATKEQRDLLFTKMKEVGYEWDAEKKELKKHEPECDTCTNDKGCVTCVDGDQWEGKPAWSEEDEEMRKDAIAAVKHLISTNESWSYLEDSLDWLKSLKERYTWKPSVEQIEALMHMRFAVEKFGPSASLAALDSLYNDLKKLM